MKDAWAELVTAGKGGRREEKGPTGFLAVPSEGTCPVCGETSGFYSCLTPLAWDLECLLLAWPLEEGAGPHQGAPLPILLGSTELLQNRLWVTFASTHCPGALRPRCFHRSSP